MSRTFFPEAAGVFAGKAKVAHRKTCAIRRSQATETVTIRGVFAHVCCARFDVPSHSDKSPIEQRLKIAIMNCPESEILHPRFPIATHGPIDPNTGFKMFLLQIPCAGRLRACNTLSIITSIGAITGPLITAELGDLQCFEQVPRPVHAILAYAGMESRVRPSGQWVGKIKMSKLRQPCFTHRPLSAKCQPRHNMPSDRLTPYSSSLSH